MRAPIPAISIANARPIDLSPARWIWYPSGRTLQNTFVLFRRQINLPEKPIRARGWVTAESRYRLEVNAQRVQWGPAPCDPRWLEVDPVDLTAQLQAGPNTIGALVLFYGQGDGTLPIGKCGFIFRLEIETASGTKQMIVTDESWQALLARSWAPGHYKRWYVRCLQEDFDARLFPYGWSSSGFVPTADWLTAMPLDCPPDKPASCGSYTDYQFDFRGDARVSQLRERSIPLMNEVRVPVAGPRRIFFGLIGIVVPESISNFLPPNSFRVDRNPAAKETGPGTWEVELDGRRGAALTLEFTDQIVGWPHFTIDAPAGTTVELMTQEAHQVGGPALLNSHFNSWARFHLPPRRKSFSRPLSTKAAVGCSCTFMEPPAKLQCLPSG